MKFSVAMCTYNGGRYLEAQLRSLVEQSRRPDELVVCDDRSSDDTVQVLERFTAAAPFAVHVHINPANLGSTRNFEKAIGLCGGDLIALCDQDDAWLPGKLEALEAVLARSPEAGLVFTDAEVVDEDSSPLGYSLWEAVWFDRRLQDCFEQGQAVPVLLKYNVATGATMAFRAALRELVMPVPEQWIQDAWIALLTAATSRCVFLRERLVQYRQHAAQQIGGRRQSLWRQIARARQMGVDVYQREATKYAQAAQRLRERAADRCSADTLALIDAKAGHFAARARMRQHRRRLPGVWAEWRSGNYRRYSLGWKSAAQDLFT